MEYFDLWVLLYHEIPIAVRRYSSIPFSILMHTSVYVILRCSKTCAAPGFPKNVPTSSMVKDPCVRGSGFSKPSCGRRNIRS